MPKAAEGMSSKERIWPKEWARGWGSREGGEGMDCDKLGSNYEVGAVGRARGQVGPTATSMVCAVTMPRMSCVSHAAASRFR